jgi:hypothetical protein
VTVFSRHCSITTLSDDHISPGYETASENVERCLPLIYEEYGKHVSELITANKVPTELLAPFLDTLSDFFMRQISSMADQHHRWLSTGRGLTISEMSRGDHRLSSSWLQFRAVLEDFQQISERIQDFMAGLETESIIAGCSEAPKMKKTMLKQKKLLIRGRNLESMIRDTIQINIGSVTLQESRRSIHQADSVGRISVLAFTFLPLSGNLFLRNEHSGNYWRRSVLEDLPWFSHRFRPCFIDNVLYYLAKVKYGSFCSFYTCSCIIDFNIRNKTLHTHCHSTTPTRIGRGN